MECSLAIVIQHCRLEFDSLFSASCRLYLEFTGVVPLTLNWIENFKGMGNGMKVIFYGAKKYDEECFKSSSESYTHDIRFVEAKLSCDTVSLINGEEAVCVFVNDTLDRNVLLKLAEAGIKLIVLRCAGYNNVDVKSAHEFGLKVVRVPAYSPYAAAEHAVCLMLALNRKVHRAYSRVREGNFSLGGLLGFDFFGRTMGVIGTGKIGSIVTRIMSGMGMKVIAYDSIRNPECEKQGVTYVSMDQLFSESDVISLHCPLTPETEHLIDKSAIEKMKQGVMLINASRGGILDTSAVIKGLKSKKIGYLGIDVYEQEDDLFFDDHSSDIILDDDFERLLTFPNVLVTAHQGFFTSDALKNIADTTLDNMTQFEKGAHLVNEVVCD